MSQQRHASRRDDRIGYPPPMPNEAEVRFVSACGLRRAELLHLRVRDIRQDEEGRLWIHVARQAGRRERDVPVLAGHEEAILARVRNLRLFTAFPDRVVVQMGRQEYARGLYDQLRRAPQDPPQIRKYNEEAAREVMQALGHDELGVVCHHYLRLQDVPAGLGSNRGPGSALTDQER